MYHVGMTIDAGYAPLLQLRVRGAASLARRPNRRRIVTFAAVRAVAAAHRFLDFDSELQPALLPNRRIGIIMRVFRNHVPDRYAGMGVRFREPVAGRNVTFDAADVQSESISFVSSLLEVGIGGHHRHRMARNAKHISRSMPARLVAGDHGANTEQAPHQERKNGSPFLS